MTNIAILMVTLNLDQIEFLLIKVLNNNTLSFFSSYVTLLLNGETMNKISVIIPVYNEQDNISILTEELNTALQNRDFEIIYVNDGSTDKSREIIISEKEKNNRIRLISFKKNAGQSAAFQCGIAQSTGDILVFLDADLQNDPADIPKMLELIADKDAVLGVRKKRQDTFVRRISSKIANAVRNAISKDNTTDTGCSLKVIRKKCFENVYFFKGMHRFMPKLIKMNGYTRICEIPVNHRSRIHGISKYGISNRLFRSFCDLLAVRWMMSRKINYSIKEDI